MGSIEKAIFEFLIGSAILLLLTGGGTIAFDKAAKASKRGITCCESYTKKLMQE